MDDVMELLAFLVIIVIPGLAATFKWLLLPSLERVVDLAKGTGEGTSARRIEARMVALEEQMDELRRDVRRIAEVQEFHRELEAPDE